MDRLQDLLERTAALHRHLCPRQVLGVRMGMLGGRLLGLDLPQGEKRVFAFMETDGCAADGVSVSTGCWVGRRTMRIMDFGRVAVTLVDTGSGRSFRIRPHAHARDRAVALLPDRGRWDAQLEGYQRLADPELLVAEPVTLRVDLAAIISRPGLRVNCQVCGEEIMNEREIRRGASIVCRSCAGETYYRVTEGGPIDLGDSDSGGPA